VVACIVPSLWNNGKKLMRSSILLASILGIFVTVFQYQFLYFSSSFPSDFYTMGKWAEAHPTEKIAMLQSGIASFIAPNVVNLDGKVNAAALEAHLHGKLPDYLRAQQFTYIADWKPFIADIDTMARKDELYFDSVGMVGSIQLMKRSMQDSTNRNISF
jgi:hypothetical protein